MLGLILWKVYLNSNDFVDENGNVWIRTDKISELQENGIPFGTVKISDNLKWGMMRYPAETRFAVVVSFASMVPDNYLETISLDGISAADYLEQSIELQEIDGEASKAAYAKYYQLKNDYLERLFESIDFAREKIIKGGVCKEEHFFYAYLTEKEIYQLTCAEDEALYVFAPGMIK